MMRRTLCRGIVTSAFFLTFALAAAAMQEPVRFGGEYAALEPAQQRLIDDWVRRFIEVTGQDVEPGPFYDDLIRLSTKTTFDAVTHALMRTTLTDEAGAALGTALDLVESLETVKGKVKGAGGDQQFRMYALLKPAAVTTLKKSREFKRGSDNTVFHKGYPVNYRQQGGVPSIQISIVRDGRRADIDVDYRASSFPVALFNGHLSSSNSDVRAGNNDARHNGRWAGLANWWQGLFGIRLNSDYEDQVADERIQLPKTPRAGKKHIDEMTYDFLRAWLLEKNVVAAMGYISERAYPCIAMDSGDPADFDRGMVPFVLMNRMKAAADALGEHDSLEGLTVGVRLTDPALKLVRQPHHAEFVLYSVPDDVAAELDCANQMKLHGESATGSRRYGNYFGATFFVNGPEGKGETVELLWAKEDGYLKIVSFEAEPMKEDPLAEFYEAPEVAITRIEADPGFASAVRAFLTAWFIEKDYDAAFRYFSPRCYSCYNLYRREGAPEAATPDEAAGYIRAALESAGERVGPRSRLDTLFAGVEPASAIVRVMTHEDEAAFTLVSYPDDVAALADCATRSRGAQIPDDIAREYGNALGMSFRFRTESGETPVFKTLWQKENGEWRITSYDVEEP